MPASSSIIHILPATLERIAPLRAEYLRELDDLVVYEGRYFHPTTQCFSVKIDDQVAGHAIALRQGQVHLLVEFYLLGPHRLHLSPAYAALARQLPIGGIRAKTNDTCLINLLYDHCRNIRVDSLHFRPLIQTDLNPPDAVLMRPAEQDLDAVHAMFTCEDAVWPSADLAQTGARIEQGLYLVLKVKDMPVGVGAMAPNRLQSRYVDLCNYVLPSQRRKGYGAFILQELRRQCDRRGWTACAGCEATNAASRATLLKAGFWDSHRMLRGETTPGAIEVK